MFKQIAIAVDLDQKENALAVVRYAQALAEKEATFHLITVIPELSSTRMIENYLTKGYDKSLLKDAEHELSAFAQANFAALDNVKLSVVHGSVYEEINRITNKVPCDVVVVAAGKPGVKGLGPNAARVARYGKKPVLIVR